MVTDLQLISCSKFFWIWARGSSETELNYKHPAISMRYQELTLPVVHFARNILRPKKKKERKTLFYSLRGTYQSNPWDIIIDNCNSACRSLPLMRARCNVGHQNFETWWLALRPLTCLSRLWQEGSGHSEGEVPKWGPFSHQWIWSLRRWRVCICGTELRKIHHFYLAVLPCGHVPRFLYKYIYRPWCLLPSQEFDGWELFAALPQMKNCCWRWRWHLIFPLCFSVIQGMKRKEFGLSLSGLPERKPDCETRRNKKGLFCFAFLCN